MMARHPLLLQKLDGSCRLAAPSAGLAAEVVELALVAAFSCAVAAAAGSSPLLPAELHVACAVKLQFEPRIRLLQP